MRSFFWLFYLLPLNLISRLAGWAATWTRPRWLLLKWLEFYCSAFKVDLSGSNSDLRSYRNFQEFFSRPLKEGSRAISSALVSPCDGVGVFQGRVSDGMLLQVKGIEYQLSDLLGSSERAESLEGGAVFQFYLAPRDYHRVHSPCDGGVVGLRHISGTLFPVHSWFVSRVRGLFAVNERVVFNLESEEFGAIILVMVGALNVGKIEVAESEDSSHVESLSTIRRPIFPSLSRMAQPLQVPDSLKVLRVGGELGRFLLGSSVILIVKDFPNTGPSAFQLRASREVKIGDSLL